MIEIYNNDFRSMLPQILTRYESRKIIIVSDPPFNIGYHYRRYTDRLSKSEYNALLTDAFSTLPSVVIHYPEMLYQIAFLIGKIPQKVVSWCYNSNTKKQHRDIAFFDIMPDFRKVRQPYKNPNDKRVKALIEKGSKGGMLYDWWNINQVKNVSREKVEHPCQMPLEVMKNIVGILPEDALIIDPFMGSGTTGVACKLFNRDFIGFDIIKDYCDIVA